MPRTEETERIEMIEWIALWTGGFIAGAIATILVMVYKGWRPPNPYRWKCLHPGCDFSCSGTDMRHVDGFATNHVRSHQ